MSRSQRRAANRRLAKVKEKREREKLQKKNNPGKIKKFLLKLKRSINKK